MFIENCSDILLFDNILSFSSNIFSCILLFLFKKYGLHVFQNGSKLQSMLSFSNYCNWAYLFRFPNRFCCHLNLTMSPRFYDLFALFLRHDLIIICFRRFSRTSITFKTYMLFHNIVKRMVLKERLHYFIFHFFLKSTRMITFSEKIFVFLGWNVLNRCN